jgi:hypothetical protein
MRLYHYLEANWALDDIRRRRLKVSYIPNMNDPYELKSARSAFSLFPSVPVPASNKSKPRG